MENCQLISDDVAQDREGFTLLKHRLQATVATVAAVAEAVLSSNFVIIMAGKTAL
jgi:hypothetical protein